mmetsp:Transcript_7996/g.13415  ORF Transcript_7996/g.13415 Transcript_7996/m.13415 type:complete len:141 (+) Transcript_7996:466-888(+)
MLTRFLYGACFVNLKILHKVYIIVVFQTLAYLIIAFSCFNDDKPAFFYVALLACVFVGFSQGMGEATFLGFLKGFPSHLVGFVSSGTGFAGISGTLLLLFFNQVLSFEYSLIYLIVSPFGLIYLASYFWLYKKTNVFRFI